MISGIIHVLKSGGRWVDAPEAYGPRETLYNRFIRWTIKGVWVRLFHDLATAGGSPAQGLIDSSAVKAHGSASGGKGGAESGDRPLARRPDDQDPRPDRPVLPADRLPADGRERRRLQGRRPASREPARLPHPAGRQRLRQRRHPQAGRGDRRGAEYPAQSQTALEALLPASPLPQPQRHRAHVLPAQGLPPRRHPIRPPRDQLPRRRLHRGHRQLLVMSLGPKSTAHYFDPRNYKI